MYNLSIPGQVSEHQLKAIEAVSQLIPAGGHVVEVGALFGRSSFAWASSVPPTATVYSIDPWEGNEGVRGLERAHNITYGLDQFKRYTADCANLIPKPGYSPNDFADWQQPIDAYYEDAVHNNPVLRRNLDFWTSHLNPNGIVCGDDYRPRFPDVVCEVNALAERLNRKLYVVDYFWCLMPKHARHPNQTTIEERLEQLEYQCRQVDSKSPTQFTLEVKNFPETLTNGELQRLAVRLTNEGKKPWPQWTESCRLEIALELDSQEILVSKLRIAPLLFPPDIGRDFLVDAQLPKDTQAGKYKVSCRLVDSSGVKLPGGRYGMNLRSVDIP